MVLESTDGTPITDEQRAAAEEVFATWETCRTSSGVNNPFEAQAQLDKPAPPTSPPRPPSSRTARPQLEAGRAKLRQGQGQLAGGQALIDQLEAANPDDPTLPALRAQVEAGRGHSSRRRKADLAKGQADLAAGPRPVRGRQRRRRRHRRHAPGQRGRPARRRPGAASTTTPSRCRSTTAR